MNRMILPSIVAVIVSYLGIALKKMYKSRVKYLTDYNVFIDELIEEISFYKLPLCDFIDKIINYKGKDFAKTLLQYKNSINTNKKIILNTIALSRGNKEIIQSCFNSIGMTDSETQIFNLKNEKVKAKNMLETEENNLRTKGELYSKLGILLGIALLILMI